MADNWISWLVSSSLCVNWYLNEVLGRIEMKHFCRSAHSKHIFILETLYCCIVCSFMYWSNNNICNFFLLKWTPDRKALAWLHFFTNTALLYWKVTSLDDTKIFQRNLNSMNKIKEYVKEDYAYLVTIDSVLCVQGIFLRSILCPKIKSVRATTESSTKIIKNLAVQINIIWAYISHQNVPNDKNEWG